MNKEEKIFAAHILHFLANGEQVALRCASNQARLASDMKMRKFFITQAHQERQHAIIFNVASCYFQPKRFQHIGNTGLDIFEKKLAEAIHRNQLAESIVAQQLLFEGLGEITLKKVSQGIEDRGLGFQRIRKTILHQEKAHHQFGKRHFHHILTAPEFDNQIIAKQCKEYLEILQQTLLEIEPILQFYHQDSHKFYTQLYDDLPAQLRDEL